MLHFGKTKIKKNTKHGLIVMLLLKLKMKKMEQRKKRELMLGGVKNSLMIQVLLNLKK
jgi:hypothetical protein